MLNIQDSLDYIKTLVFNFIEKVQVLFFSEFFLFISGLKKDKFETKENKIYLIKKNFQNKILIFLMKDKDRHNT